VAALILVTTAAVDAAVPERHRVPDCVEADHQELGGAVLIHEVVLPLRHLLTYGLGAGLEARPWPWP
jgi:hypothetical protein